MHTWDNQFPADARILNLLFTFSFRKSEVITDVYTHLLKQETLCRLIENLTVTFSDLGGKFANTDRQKSLFCRICSIRNNNFVACTCFQVVNFNKKKKKKANGWFLASCRALQVTNVSECGLCQCFQLFLPNSVCSFSLFWGFICVFLFFISTMAVLEPFSQIKKNKTEPV